MKKVCSACNINKPLSEFYKDKAKKDGLTYKCKECMKTYDAKHKKENKESIAASSAQYYQDNKEARVEYDKKWRENNKENNKTILKNMVELNMSEGYGIYKITHLPTQCFYIGEGQLYARRYKHFNLLKKGANICRLLQEHYNKHSNIDEWQFEVIYKFDDYDKETGRELEAFIIEESREKYPTQILNKQS